MNQNADLFAGGNGGHGGEPPEFVTPLARSIEELRAKTIGQQTGWEFGKAAHLSLDMSRGDLLFTFDDRVVATCPAQIVGSLDDESGRGCGPGTLPSPIR